MKKSWKDNAPITERQFADESDALQARFGDPPPFPAGHRPWPCDGGAGRAHRRVYVERVCAGPRHQDVARDLAELPRPGDVRGLHRRDRRRGRGQCLRLERGDAGQAAGRRHGLGPLRSDQLHDLDLCQARPDRPARPVASCRTSMRRRTNARFTEPRARSTARPMPLPKNWGTTGMAINTSKIEDQADDVLEGLLRRRHGRGSTAAPWSTTTS